MYILTIIDASPCFFIFFIHYSFGPFVEVASSLFQHEGTLVMKDGLSGDRPS